MGYEENTIFWAVLQCIAEPYMQCKSFFLCHTVLLLGLSWRWLGRFVLVVSPRRALLRPWIWLSGYLRRIRFTRLPIVLASNQEKPLPGSACARLGASFVFLLWCLSALAEVGSALWKPICLRAPCSALGQVCCSRCQFIFCLCTAPLVFGLYTNQCSSEPGGKDQYWSSAAKNQSSCAARRLNEAITM